MSMDYTMHAQPFFRIGHIFLGANPIWPQQFLGKNNSDSFQSFSFFHFMFVKNFSNILRFYIIERCGGIEKTAPNQISLNFTRVCEILKINAIASSN